MPLGECQADNENESPSQQKVVKNEVKEAVEGKSDYYKVRDGVQSAGYGLVGD